MDTLANLLFATAAIAFGVFAYVSDTRRARALAKAKADKTLTAS